jgi:hypothetical protein
MLPSNSNNPQHRSTIVWEPIPNSSQALALDTRCKHTLYTGARGPGKTDIQLMRFRRRVGLGYGAFWRGIILDREYKHLDDLVAKSKRWFPRFEDGAKFLEAAKDYKWVWPTGEELLFRSIKKLEEYDNYHGHEYPFIGWNELTKYPSPAIYDAMVSTNRSSFTPEKDSPTRISLTGKFLGYNTPDGQMLPKIPLEVFSTCNPWGPGHGWVKSRFITVAPYGKVVRRSMNLFNPQTQRNEDIEITQVAIFGSYRENIYLAPEYVAELESITDENKRQAWLHGNWDIVAGGALDDVWKSKVHIVPRFKIPKTWYVDRSFDWGSSHPFSVGWWAEANGEEATLPDGSTFCPPAGTLIQIYEWYGCTAGKHNEGLRLSAATIAKQIKEIDTMLYTEGWIPESPWPGPADNQIRDVREIEVDTIEKKMEDEGVRWTHSDKSPGSRINGLQLMRDRLSASIAKERPGLYFMQNCKASIDILPTLPRDEDKPDDVDTESEDHVYDMTRYRVLSGNNRFARSIVATQAR